MTYKKVVIDVEEISVDIITPLILIGLTFAAVITLTIYGYKWVYVHKITDYAPNREFDPLLSKSKESESLLPF